MSQDDLPEVARRFLRYVQIDTSSDPESQTTPSTEKQKDLSRLLRDELRYLGLQDADMDEYGYVFASLPASGGASSEVSVALLAHVDTSPDEPGGPVKPIVHRGYDGGVITLPGDPSVKMDPARSPALADHVGHDLITGDGTTLLGSDDKAGVAIIMQTVADLLADSSQPRPEMRICFTVDEEIGRGVDKLDLQRLDADLAYTVDGSTVGELATETFNASTAIVRVRGVNVHPGTAKDIMANAAVILSRLISALPASEMPETTAGQEGYFCPMESGGDVAEAKALILLRDFTDAGMARRKQLITQLVKAAEIENPRAKISLEITDTYRNMKSYIEEKDPRVVSFALAAAEEMGLEMTEESIRGGTDGSRLSELGVPTPNIFTGGHDYHSRFEWNTVQNLEQALAYVKQVMKYWALHGSEPSEENKP